MLQSSSPFLSIIIPTYNSEIKLPKTLESIISQSFRDFEILILDNNSSDNTTAITNSYDDERIRVFSDKDKGVYDAMNKGISYAKGKWLYFIGSDDTLATHYVLENIFDQVKQNSVDLVYGTVLIAENCTSFGEELNWIKIFQKCPCHQAIFYKKELFKKYGGYNLEYPINADWEKNIIFFNSEIKTKFLNIIVAVFSNQGLSGRNYDKNLFSNLLTLKSTLIKERGIIDKLSFFVFSDTNSLTKKWIKFLLRNSFFIFSSYRR